jgi:5-methylcytosine-specific restriction endonuclease McrA
MAPRRPTPWRDDWRSWYQLERWRRIRHAQLLKEPLCRFCAANGKATPATIADHVASHRCDWNAFWLGKLQSLCKPCHDSAKKLADRSQHLDADGWPIPRAVSPASRFPTDEEVSDEEFFCVDRAGQ